MYASARLQFGHLTVNWRDDLTATISCSLDVAPIAGAYILYKRVNKIKDGEYASCYDRGFVYRDGQIAEVPAANPDPEVSCGTGIHVAGANYWINEGGDTTIALQVRYEDIITCLEGRVRCRKALVLGEVGLAKAQAVEAVVPTEKPKRKRASASAKAKGAN